MAIYGKKYTLEFDDVVEGEFNDYRLEIFKKYETDNLNTSDNVYVNAANNDQGLLYKGTPVYIEGGVIYRSKANDSTSMPATGIMYADLSQGSSGNVLINGMMDYPTSWGDQYAWVDSAGGLALTEPTSGVVQKIGYKSGTGTGSFFVLFDSVVQLTGTNNPVILNYNVTSDDVFATMRSSYLDINVYHTTNFSNDELWDLYLCQDDAFKVYLYKGNDLFWFGWMGSSLIQEQQISSPYGVSLKAYDGLHLLKKTSYFDTTEVFQAFANQYNDRYGYSYIKDIIGKCLINTGYAEITNGINTTNYIISSLRIINKNETQSLDSEYFLDDTKMHHTSFLNGESDSMTCFEVLEMILTSLGATIYQRDGNWCIVRISNLTTSNQANDVDHTCRMDWSWVDHETPTSINKTTTAVITDKASSYYTGDTQFKQIDGASTMTFQYPYQRVIVKQENDENWITSNHVDSVNDLGATDPSGLYLFDEWEPQYDSNGTKIQEAVVLRDNDYRTASQTGNANYFNKNTEELPKSLIEADLGVFTFVPRNQEACLKYPVSHIAIKRSYDYTEEFTDPVDTNYEYNPIKMDVKFRPLSSTGLSEDEYVYVQFTPRLIINNPNGYSIDNTMSRIADGVSKIIAAFLSPFNDNFGLLNFRPFKVKTKKINEWQTQEAMSEYFGAATTTDNTTPASHSQLEFRIYGGYVSDDGGQSNTGYTDLKDVTYTEIKSYPTVSKYRIITKKQEYSVEQSDAYSKVVDLEVKLGSNIVTTGANCFIGFERGTNNPLLSFNDWKGEQTDSTTIQHLCALSRMMMYRMPVRRIDGVHYGSDYKYGNKMVYDDGLSIGGSASNRRTTGKFYPMGVSMNLRMARTTFAGDDLINNLNPYQPIFTSANYPKKIKWMGEGDESETEDY